MPIFDPDTGKVVDKDALRSLQFNGQGMRVPRTKVVDGKKLVEVIDERDGSTGGYHTHHPSGRQDADVFAKPAASSVGGGSLN